MAILKQVSESLDKYVRPQSFPLAVRMCETSAELPGKVFLPKRDFGVSITVCQGLAMARRYGWIIAIGKEDQVCPHGHVVLGFVPRKLYLTGTLAETVGLGNKEEFVRATQGLSVLEYAKYSHLLAAPINIAEFEPHFILVFGNPAQLARLIQGVTARSSGLLTFIARGGISCSVSIARTMLTNECQVVLTGAGDRYFALTQDHEMAFTIPMSEAESTIQGLESTHKRGQRYPTPSWLRFEGHLPPEYYKLTEILLKER